MHSGSRGAASMHSVTPTRRSYLILGLRRKWFSDSFDIQMRERRLEFTAMLSAMRIGRQSRKLRRFWTPVDANRQSLTNRISYLAVLGVGFDSHRPLQSNQHLIDPSSCFGRSICIHLKVFLCPVNS